MQIKVIKVRDSKFGTALVFETYPKAGGYILGFKIEPEDKLIGLYKEIVNLHQLFASNPIFGVDYTIEEEMPSTQQLLQPRVEEDFNLLEEQEDSHAVAAYFLDGVDEVNTAIDIQFDSRLGLAVEAMQEGLTIDQLWRVI
jgi:Bardet-Biedl syndrome 5 protein